MTPSLELKTSQTLSKKGNCPFFKKVELKVSKTFWQNKNNVGLNNFSKANFPTTKKKQQIFQK
jgi:hypothetical protein